MQEAQSAAINNEYRRVPIGILAESATNPRKRFDQRNLEELAASRGEDTIRNFKHVKGAPKSTPFGRTGILKLLRLQPLFEAVKGRLRTEPQGKWRAGLGRWEQSGRKPV